MGFVASVRRGGELAKERQGRRQSLPLQFRDRGLALHVVTALAKSGLPAQRLELEVTERLLLEDSDGTLAAMEQLKNLGVSIWLRGQATSGLVLRNSRGL